MELKNIVDFAYSLTNMDEVSKGIFKLPKEILFELDEKQHMKIEREVLHQKGVSDDDITHFKSFDVKIFDINFKFVRENEDKK
jgi:hypothetical protein|tara:strand:+ start:2654 stop:2902 length:249 start_codon:yes stop_codon:yes gene_type:complete